jgi:YqaJ-like viral recombinase domain
MTVEYFDMEQNSPEWAAIRAGLPTASSFADVLARGEGKSRRSYLDKLAAEIVTGQPLESYRNAYMDRGHAQEDDARRAYALLMDAEPKRVGFIRNGRKGCSPDSLLDANAGLEIKTQRADLLIATWRADKFPSAHVAQCQGFLWVAEREWVDIAVYAPGMPLFVKRAYRDERYIGELAREVDAFLDDLDETVAMVRQYWEQAA